MYSMPGQGEMKLFVGNLPSDITADPGQGKLFVGNLPSDITADQLQYVLPSALDRMTRTVCRNRATCNCIDWQVGMLAARREALLSQVFQTYGRVLEVHPLLRSCGSYRHFRGECYAP